MTARAMSQVDVKLNLIDVKRRILQAVSKRNPTLGRELPVVVAVSKTKPKELIVEAYQDGQRHFGENYVQEIVEKGNDDLILTKCPDIKWHFIGHLQRNKVNKLLTVPNLYAIETVDSLKLAAAVGQAWGKQHPTKEHLNIFLQVNTSQEAEKSGCAPDEVPKLAASIQEQCANLEILGLMTIGKYDNYDEQVGVNPDFQSLLNCREPVANVLGKSPCEIQLSMGMSGDFEHAVEVGSTSVRIGSGIFGARDYSK